MAVPQGRLAFIEASHGAAVLAGLREDRTLGEKPETAREAMVLLAQCDPSHNSKDKPGRYLSWLAQRYSQEWKAAQKEGRDHAIPFSDFGRVRDDLGVYDAKKNKLPQDQRDIYKLDFAGLREVAGRPAAMAPEDRVRAAHGLAVLAGLKADRTLDKKPETVKDAVTLLAQCDPTYGDQDKPGRYLPWLARIYTQEWEAAQKQGRDHAILFEDFERVKDYLNVYDQRKHGLPPDLHDIYQLDYKGLKEAAITLRGKEKEILSSDEIMAQTTILYKGEEGMVLVPHSRAASIYWGQGTQWCTASSKSGNSFQSYNSDGPLVVMITAAKEKFQTHRDSDLMDEQDSSVKGIPDSLGSLLKALPPALLEVVKKNSGSALSSQGDSWGDRNFVLKRVKEDGKALQFADPLLQSDREIVLEAVRQSGWALQFADPLFQSDREVVLEAVKKDGWALQFADPLFQSDREVVLEAVKKDGWALAVADPLLRSDREIVLEAIRQDGRALEYADPLLRSDREIVLEAVRQDGRALEYADPLLRSDREIVLEAVRQDGRALEYADPLLRSDREIVLEAVRQGGYALEYADPLLRSDREIMLEAVRQDGYALVYVDPMYRGDREIVLEAVRRDGKTLEHVAPFLQDDCKVVLEAVRQNENALRYANQSLISNPDFIEDVIRVNICAMSCPPGINPANISLEALREGFKNTIRKDWTAIAYLPDVGEEILSVTDELMLFERGLADSKKALGENHLHLFPSLQKNGAFMTMGIEEAHRHLQSLAGVLRQMPVPPAAEFA